MRRKRTTETATALPGFGNHAKLPDQRVPLTGFETDGRFTFDQLVASLEAGNCCVRVKVVRAGETLPRRGRATEVDSSGIVRVESFNENKHGVAFLISMVDGQLYGEFAD